MSWLITGGNTYTPMDSDAAAYIAAVEGVSGDNQALEPAVRCAIDQFVLGCKTDGIWTAIKASCILAGARTLSGALVPLVGAAPTNVGDLFVSGDYNRKTGLVGNGSTKYLNSNRNNNADPQNSQHICVHTTAFTSGFVFLGAGPDTTGTSMLLRTSPGLVSGRSRNADAGTTTITFTTGFFANSRGLSTGYTVRNSGSSQAITQASETPYNGNLFVFANNTGAGAGAHVNARLAFYSIGESLDLALLDARVTALINAIAAAIP